VGINLGSGRLVTHREKNRGGDRGEKGLKWRIEVPSAPGGVTEVVSNMGSNRGGKEGMDIVNGTRGQGAPWRRESGQRSEEGRTKKENTRAKRQPTSRARKNPLKKKAPLARFLCGEQDPQTPATTRNIWYDNGLMSTSEAKYEFKKNWGRQSPI